MYRTRGRHVRSALAKAAVLVCVAGMSSLTAERQLVAVLYSAALDEKALAVAETKDGPGVIVFVSSDGGVPTASIRSAEAEATRIFGCIGVSVSWRDGQKHRASADGNRPLIAVRVESDVPMRFRTGALAYTNPEPGGAVIHIFYDRVAAVYRRDLSSVVLAYVLAHEIAHVLQGTARHSEDGILKPFWESKDYRAMLARRLTFTREDISRIRRNIGATTAEYHAGRND